jgi:hypothetical protein
MDRTNPPKKRLSETLSSDALFTFTTKLEYLISMLEKGIYPRYIYERIPIPDKTWYYTVAAKCFCDIPLGKIKSHLNWFGNYGLGIKKTYLKEKGASPIMYIHDKSKWIVDALISGGISNLKSYPTLPFLKRHKGHDFKQEDDGTYTPSFRPFYDEREWRYIPKINDLTTGDDIRLIKDGIDMIRQKNILNPYLKSRIKLKPDLIEYIIIDTFNEFKELKTKLRILYLKDDDYELMLSKILIAQRIVRDF